MGDEFYRIMKFNKIYIDSAFRLEYSIYKNLSLKIKSYASVNLYCDFFDHSRTFYLTNIYYEF